MTKLDDAYRYAEATVPPDVDNVRDAKLMREAMRDYLTANQVDVDDLADQAITAHLRQLKRPGGRPADGQLHFPGMDPIDYESERLLTVETEGPPGLVTFADTKPKHLRAQARRGRKDGIQKIHAADLLDQRTDVYEEWAIARLLSGANPTSITFDNFVRLNGIWKP